MTRVIARDAKEPYKRDYILQKRPVIWCWAQKHLLRWLVWSREMFLCSTSNHRSLLPNIVSFIGLFCISCDDSCDLLRRLVHHLLLWSQHPMGWLQLVESMKLYVSFVIAVRDIRMHESWFMSYISRIREAAEVCHEFVTHCEWLTSWHIYERVLIHVTYMKNSGSSGGVTWVRYTQMNDSVRYTCMCKNYSKAVVRSNLAMEQALTHCNTLQRTAAHCSTLPHTATHCNTLRHAATHCSTLQHTATHCNTLQHTATPYNTLQHTAH